MKTDSRFPIPDLRSPSSDLRVALLALVLLLGLALGLPAASEPTGSGYPRVTRAAESNLHQVFQWTGSGYVTKTVTESSLLGSGARGGTNVVMVFGSSVALADYLGTGVGWVYQLSNACYSDGIRVLNSSVAGNTTADVIARYPGEAMAARPDFSVFALSLYNQGLIGSGDKPLTGRLFTSNLFHLCRVARALGSTPVLGKAYGNTNYTAADLAVVRAVNLELESSGELLIDNASALADAAGRWLPIIVYDGAHPNALGQTNMFRSVNWNIFRKRFPPFRTSGSRTNEGLFLATGDAVASPAVWTPEIPLLNWSVALWVRADTNSVDNKTFINVNPGTGRLRNTSGFYNYLSPDGSANVTSGINSGTNYLTHLALTYHSASNLLTLYTNGVAVGSITTTNQSPTAFTIAGRADSTSFNAQTYWFRDLGIWRVPLSAADVLRVYRGQIPTASCDFFSPLNEPVAGLPAYWPNRVAGPPLRMNSTNFSESAYVPN